MENKIDICAMQEIDIPSGYDTTILSFKGYELLTENNDVKMRTGVYIRNGMNYSRQSALEGVNNHHAITCAAKTTFPIFSCTPHSFSLIKVYT